MLIMYYNKFNNLQNLIVNKSYNSKVKYKAYLEHFR